MSELNKNTLNSENLIVSIDSFNICKEYRQLKTITIGGFRISFLIKDQMGELFSFMYDSSYPDEFDLKGYLTLFPTFVNKLPKNFPGATLFSESFLKQKLEEYSIIIHCEDFYYQEFINKYPNRTPQQNRTREGWNFEQYLRERKNQ